MSTSELYVVSVSGFVKRSFKAEREARKALVDGTGLLAMARKYIASSKIWRSLASLVSQRTKQGKGKMVNPIDEAISTEDLQVWIAEANRAKQTTLSKNRRGQRSFEQDTFDQKNDTEAQRLEKAKLQQAKRLQLLKSDMELEQKLMRFRKRRREYFRGVQAQPQKSQYFMADSIYKRNTNMSPKERQEEILQTQRRFKRRHSPGLGDQRDTTRRLKKAEKVRTTAERDEWDDLLNQDGSKRVHRAKFPLIQQEKKEAETEPIIQKAPQLTLRQKYLQMMASPPQQPQKSPQKQVPLASPKQSQSQQEAIVKQPIIPQPDPSLQQFAPQAVAKIDSSSSKTPSEPRRDRMEVEYEVKTNKIPEPETRPNDNTTNLNQEPQPIPTFLPPISAQSLETNPFRRTLNTSAFNIKDLWADLTKNTSIIFPAQQPSRIQPSFSFSPTSFLQPSIPAVPNFFGFTSSSPTVPVQQHQVQGVGQANMMKTAWQGGSFSIKNSMLSVKPLPIQPQNPSNRVSKGLVDISQNPSFFRNADEAVRMFCVKSASELKNPPPSILKAKKGKQKERIG